VQKKKQKQHAPQAKDFTQKKGSRYRQLTEAEQSANRYKSKIRSRVEPVFGVMKRQFGFTKVRYRGLDKNAQCDFTRCALVNLVLAKKRLLAV
jgi:IS5 family transposase